MIFWVELSYKFLFNGCCRGSSAQKAIYKGVKTHTDCEKQCDQDKKCNAIETNGWNSDGSNPSGKCYHFHGSGNNQFTNGKCVTNGDQKCYQKPSNRFNYF